MLIGGKIDYLKKLIIQHLKKVGWDIVIREKPALLYIIDNRRGCKDIIKSFGLKGMTDRVQDINGLIKFSSDGGTGFSIHVELPIGGE